jgi:hypothetical protein
MLRKRISLAKGRSFRVDEGLNTTAEMYRWSKLLCIIWKVGYAWPVNHFSSSVLDIEHWKPLKNNFNLRLGNKPCSSRMYATVQTAGWFEAAARKIAYLKYHVFIRAEFTLLGLNQIWMGKSFNVETRLRSLPYQTSVVWLQYSLIVAHRQNIKNIYTAILLLFCVLQIYYLIKSCLILKTFYDKLPSYHWWTS